MHGHPQQPHRSSPISTIQTKHPFPTSDRSVPSPHHQSIMQTSGRCRSLSSIDLNSRHLKLFLEAHKTDKHLQDYTLPTPNKSYLLAVFCFKTSKCQDLLHTAHWSKRENSTRYERKTQEQKTRDCIASAQEGEAE
jgi:hypothetical protein